MQNAWSGRPDSFKVHTQESSLLEPERQEADVLDSHPVEAAELCCYMLLYVILLCSEVIDVSAKDVLTVNDAAELLGISPYTVRKQARQGLIPGRKIGKEWRFSRESLVDWLGCELSRDDLAAVRRGIEDMGAGRVVSWEALREELGE